MNTKELFNSLLESYNKGCKVGKLQDVLRSSKHNGFTVSYDGSLLIAYFGDGLIVIGCGVISFYPNI